MGTYQTVLKGDVIVVEPHLDRAKASLRAAELLQGEGLFADAASRAHQSTIHAERALLATEKRSPNELRSVHRLAAQHFIGNDLLDRGHLQRLDDLFVLRNRADAQPDPDVSEADSTGAVATATWFLADVTAFLNDEGHL